MSASDDSSELVDKMANLEVDNKEKQSGETEDKETKQADDNTESNKQTKEVTEGKEDEKTTDADVAHKE